MVSLLLVVASPIAGAQVETRPLGAVLDGEAKQAYEAARILFADGDFEGALAKFLHAYELSSEPRLLWNMAVCEKEQRHYARASQLIERYLSEGARSLPASSIKNAEDVLSTLRAFSSRVSLEGAPEGAHVLIDGVEVGTVPLNVPLHVDLGRHQLRIEAPGYEPFRKMLDLPGDTDVTVPVTMRRETAPARLGVTTGPKHTIRIDGRVVGEERWEGPLPPGRRKLRITAPGKKPYELDVDLAPNSNRLIHATLEDEAVDNELWPWILGGSVIVAGAAVGGYFLLTNRSVDVQGPSGQLGRVDLPLLHRF